MVWTATLTFTHKTGPDDQWLYLPTLKRVKRISSDNRSGAFVGSEFAYEDLSSQEIEKYTYKWIEDVPCPGPTDQRVGDMRNAQSNEIVVSHSLSEDGQICITNYETTTTIEKLLPTTAQISTTAATACWLQEEAIILQNLSSTSRYQSN